MLILGEIDARVGRKEDAINEGEHALALLPVEKDAIDGPVMLARIAAIYGRLGEIGPALDRLETAAKMPVVTNYGALQLDETWDPLRAEPRFQAIVASLAPSPDSK